MIPRLRSATVVAAALLAVLAVACGGTGSWRATDRAFVAAMIPHHHLGMRLIDDATQRSDDVRLRRLVFEMTGYHHSETEMLEQWAAAHDIAHGSPFPGDLPADELARLATLRGVERDVWWLDLMIRHHRGALEIADAQIAGGGVAAVREMAVSVRRVQATEIGQMEDLLVSLCTAQEQQGAAVPTGCP